jgi:hypothetical protein
MLKEHSKSVIYINKASLKCLICLNIIFSLFAGNLSLIEKNLEHYCKIATYHYI